MSEAKRSSSLSFLFIAGVLLALVVVGTAALTATGGRTSKLLGTVGSTLSSADGRPVVMPANPVGLAKGEEARRPLVHLPKSYVDKLTKMKPAERQKLSMALHAFTGEEVIDDSVSTDRSHFVGYGVNPFVETKKDKYSTFAIDVDTGAYTIMRNYLTKRTILPPKNSVRVEEYINYFDYEYAAPEESAFAVHTEAAPSPYRKNHLLLRIGVKGKEIEKAERKPLCLTFVVDVSGSMSSRNRLPLVRQALSLLIDELQEGDRVAIAVYGSRGRKHLDYVEATNKEKIKNSINKLRTEGATNAEEGLKVAYEMAAANYSPDWENRVILCSDGVANVGRTGPKAILAQIKKEAAKGIYLTTVGFGMGSYNDRMMEQLANKGNGIYAYVDSLKEAKRIFVEKMTGTMLTVAKDAKIQVEFSATTVKRYRLLGYENRDVADKDFRNDAIDAGEVGAGHSATALYELELTDELTDTLGTVRVRYQAPQGNKITEIQEKISTDCISGSFEKASSAYRLAAIVAQYAEILRHSDYAKGRTIEELIPQIDRVARELKHDESITEFSNLIAKAAERELSAD